jgi:hypothetical protein
VADLRDGQPVDEAFIDALSDDALDALVLDPAVTWSMLSRQPARDTAMFLLERRIQRLLLDDEWARVRRELDGEALVRGACDEPRLEALALRAATALAMEDPEDGVHYAAEYASERHRALEPLYETCERVLSVAPLWRALSRAQRIPRPLRRFVTLQWSVSQAVLDSLVADLRADMLARAPTYLHILDVSGRVPALLEYIVSLSDRFLPAVPATLTDLGDDERSRLGAVLGDIDAPLARPWRMIQLVGGVLAAGALVSMGGFDRAALVVMGVLGLAVTSYWVRSESGLYRRAVRPQLAAYLADVGTPIECVVSWLMANRGRVKKIKSFDGNIESDRALGALARLGRMTRSHLLAP